jgi:hypothetical protein
MCVPYPPEASASIGKYALLDVAGVHGDGIPKMEGEFTPDYDGTTRMGFYKPVTSGVFTRGGQHPWCFNGAANSNAYAIKIDTSRVMPAANKVQTRAWGSLGCVYLGSPAS